MSPDDQEKRTTEAPEEPSRLDEVAVEINSSDHEDHDCEAKGCNINTSGNKKDESKKDEKEKKKEEAIEVKKMKTEEEDDKKEKAKDEGGEDKMEKPKLKDEGEDDKHKKEKAKEGGGEEENEAGGVKDSKDKFGEKKKDTAEKLETKQQPTRDGEEANKPKSTVDQDNVPAMPTGQPKILEPKWLDETFRPRMLKLHKEFRENHDADELVIDDRLNSIAQDFAERLAIEGSVQDCDACKCIKHSYVTWFDEKRGKTVRLGENVYCCFHPQRQIDDVAEDAIYKWYNEILGYDYSKSEEKIGETGHFTQLVWKKSKLLGVGCAEAIGGRRFVVCNYSPAGNVLTQFSLNVNEPKSNKTKDKNEYMVETVDLSKYDPEKPTAIRIRQEVVDEAKEKSKREAKTVAKTNDSPKKEGDPEEKKPLGEPLPPDNE